MILKVKQWPESQDVMHDDEWFFIMAGDSENDPLGNSAYAMIVDNKKYLDEGSDIGRDKGYQESQRQVKIATDALNLLSRYPVASLNYAYVAISALEKMYPMRKTLRESHEKITSIKKEDQNEDK
jgi:hypothetical protein|tara:strand:- start:7318 stop:7692 length:375 start_codon:yes stop_codon:yes gene_type:complete